MKKRKLTKFHYTLLGINIFNILLFGSLFVIFGNYEFCFYLGVVSFFVGLVFVSFKYVEYTKFTLVALTVWALLHLAGGGIYLDENMRLYGKILIPFSKTWPILRYDQVVHAFGFFSATLASFCILKKSLKTLDNTFSLGIILVTSGMGFGAMNEIVEFFSTLMIEKVQVGGYINTSLDLCSNFIGAVAAWVFIRKYYIKK